ncbi:autotransporter outer membrane beta-barrel domain-containing protein [Neisseria sp. Ec49-e6-T10]|uniref:autotransporter outer membrane beta-barrel domain-containing protein n=1 Tax=Neisseria sp. Ec49-e6-T10 TaxID=3140744 RepID=UPI003EBF2202
MNKSMKKTVQYKKTMTQPTKIFQAISFLGLGLGTTFSAFAVDCVVATSQVNGSVTCDASDTNVTMISVKAGAKVTHNTGGADLTITNASSTNTNTTDFPSWGSNVYGIRASGAGAEYILNTQTSKGNVSIDVGNNANMRGYGVLAENNGTVTIYANKLEVVSRGNYTNDWSANDALHATRGGVLNIYADQVFANVTNATTPHGTIGAVGGTINIKGNTGLSTTTITNGGKSSSIAGIWADAGGVANLELVNIDMAGSSNYLMGIYTKMSGTQVNFLGGDIGTTGSHAGTGIRTFELSNVTAKGYNNGHLTVTTNGLDARGVRATGESKVVLNADKYANFVTTIHTTGTISDGLNAGRLGTMHSDGSIHRHAGEIGSEYASSSITTYGQTHIQTDSNTSYGLRLIGDGATINMYAVAGQGRSTVHSASTSVRFGFGHGYSVNSDGSTAIKQQSMTLEQVDLTHNGQSGQFALGNDTSSFLCRVSSSLCDMNGNNTATSGNLIQVGDHSIDVGVQSHLNNNNAAMTVADAVKDGVLNLKNSTATAVEGKDLLNVTYGGGTALVADKVSSSFTLNAYDQTILKGSISTDTTLDAQDKPSSTVLNISNGSQWYTTRDSNLTELNTQNAEVYLNRYDSWRDAANNLILQGAVPTDYTTLTTNKLSGTGRFYFNTDIVAGHTDLLKVTDTNAAIGNHTVVVKNDASQSTTGDERLDIIQTNGGAGQFSLAQNVELGAWEYELRKNPDQINNWELVQATAKPTTTVQTTYSLMNTNYLLNYIDTQTLLQRMGELRQSQPNGIDVWIRSTTGKLDSFEGNIFDGYDMDYIGLQGGADKQISIGSGKLYLGAMAGYTQADHGFAGGGDGKAKSYQFGVYGTYLTQNGLYIDGVIKYAHLKNDFMIYDSQNNRIKGDGNSDSYSASIEVGKRFNLAQTISGKVYLEPQAQLTYTHQNSLSQKTNSGLKADFDSYDSTLFRGSVIVGYDMNQLNNPISVYFKTGYVQELSADVSAKVNHINVSHYSFKNGWWDNGLGVTARFNKQHNLFAEIDYAMGSKFDKKQLNIGYRYEF